MKINKNILYSALFVAIAAVAVVVVLTQPSKAVTASDWKPGNIINDSLFTDGDGMSVSEIQSFLVKLLPSCDVHGSKTSELGGGTRAQYGASVGNPAPFTCITNYYEVPKTTPSPAIPENNYGRYNPDGSTYIPPGSKSAAQLIYDASQRYSINPKALIIKLATESAGPLTSDSWPLKSQYYYVMGAHCPDSGPGGAANCNINYSGFSMQIAESAKLLRDYLDGMEQSWWPYKRVGGGIDRSINGSTKDICSNRYGVQNSNCIGWNVPQRGCGGTVVNIETKATAALYTYTPYQPNAAALNNMYGSGDNCSAYGNRNFWRVWNDWFGSTQEAGYTPFFQIPGSAKTYVFGADKTYYSIDSYQRLVDYGFESSFKLRVKQVSQASLGGYLNKGDLPAISRFEGIGVFILIDGRMHPFPSEEILESYGYKMGQEAKLPKEVSDVLTQGDPLWNVVGTRGGGATYYIASGRKQAMCNWDVYTNLGTPVYSSQPMTLLSSRHLADIPNGAPIAMDGDVIESTDRTLFGVWSNGSFIPMDSNTAKSSGAVNCGVQKDAVNQLPKSTKEIDNLTTSTSGASYVLEGRKKLTVNQPETATLDIPAEKYVEVTDKFLEKLTPEPLSKLVRVDGDIGVYLIEGGRAYGIPSETDLFGLGYNFNDVRSVSQRTFQLAPRDGLALKPGSVVRESTSLELYLIDKDFKRHYISSEDILFNYGRNWSDVRVLPKDSLSGYKKEGALQYYIKENDSLYWLMDKGVKRKIPNNLIANTHYNITEANSSTLTVAVLKNYPMTQQLDKTFRAEASPAVYIIENGKKRAFTNEGAFFARGYKWSDVRSLSSGYVNSLPNGAYITQ